MKIFPNSQNIDIVSSKSPHNHARILKNFRSPSSLYLWPPESRLERIRKHPIQPEHSDIGRRTPNGGFLKKLYCGKTDSLLKRQSYGIYKNLLLFNCNNKHHCYLSRARGLVNNGKMDFLIFVSEVRIWNFSPMRRLQNHSATEVIIYSIKYWKFFPNLFMIKQQYRKFFQAPSLTKNNTENFSKNLLRRKYRKFFHVLS